MQKKLAKYRIWRDLVWGIGFAACDLLGLPLQGFDLVNTSSDLEVFTPPKLMHFGNIWMHSASPGCIRPRQDAFGLGRMHSAHAWEAECMRGTPNASGRGRMHPAEAECIQARPNASICTRNVVGKKHVQIRRTNYPFKIL